MHTLPLELQPLRDHIVKNYSEAWKLNDLAHQEDHFKEVTLCGIHINETLALGYSPKIILLAGYFHDMFAWSRFNHHEMSDLWVRTNDHPLFTELFPLDRRLVSLACLEHRASFKGEFTSVFSQLINTADRGFPGDVDAMLTRAIQYREKHTPQLTSEEIYSGAVAHLKEKYGHGGYARYNQMYDAVFGNQLAEQRDAIMAL